MAALVSPPYDVIAPALQIGLAARHPRNSVLLDLPPDAPGDVPGERYVRAADAFAAWRGEGTLRKDPAAAVYAYEQTYRVPGTRLERRQRGFFARLRLEAYGPDSGVKPHERTLGGPKEDRYALLRATGANFSAMVGLYRSPHGESGPILDAVTAEPPVNDLIDDDGVRHRLWLVTAGRRGDGGPADRLMALAEAGSITIADGHHRYETALRYRDERAAEGLDGVDLPYGFMLALLFDTAATTLTILPTHRIVQGPPLGEELLAAAADFGDVERLPSAAALVAAFPPVWPASPNGRGEARIGLWSRGVAAILRPDLVALEPYLDASASPLLRALGVSQLQGLLGAIFGLGPAELAAGGSVSYLRDAAAACAVVDRGEAGTAFLLEPITADEVTRVAAAGEAMPQKSTYFYPKPATGLLFSPAEW